MTGLARERRIAVLGAGIMGCSLALCLARRGASVTLIDEMPVPFANASRWNEGKIHLGYLYAADPSLATALKVIPGGLAFRGIVEQLIGRSLDGAVSMSDDIFLTHRDSVVDADTMAAYFNAVSHIVRDHPGKDRYLVDVTDARAFRLTTRELRDVTASPKIVAGFRVPERSVQTNWLADRFVEAIDAEPLINVMLNTRLQRVVEDPHGWRIVAAATIKDSFDSVVNCLWQGRTAVDIASGFASPDIASRRYRLSLFVRTDRECNLPSAVVSTGPFGDIKNYNGRDLYLSWYPAGLIVDNEGADQLLPPSLNAEKRRDVAQRTLEGLAEYFPEVTDLAQAAVVQTVAGGWVVAYGHGSLTDRASPLHRRDRFGVTRIGSYFTVDTGKYSSAPSLALRLADEILG